MLSFLREVQLEKSSSSDLLHGKRLAVEGRFFLESVMDPLDDPLLLAFGGLPRTLFVKLGSAVLSLMSTTSQRLVFVFSGLALQNEPTSSEGADRGDGKAWRRKQNGRNLCADERFTNTVIGLLRSLNVECIVAPYKAWAQLGYLSQIGEVDMVLGSVCNLLYGDSTVKLVTNVNFSLGIFSWIDGSTLHATLGVSNSQLMHACLDAGLDVHSGIESGSAQQFDHSLALVRHQKHDRPSGGPSFTALRHMCVMYQHCKVEPLDSIQAQISLSLVFGPRLPDFCFYFMLEGGISASLLNAVLSGKLFDVAPRLDTLQYRQLLNRLIPLRSITHGILTEALHPTFSHQKLVMMRYYDCDAEYPLEMDFGTTLRCHRLVRLDSLDSKRRVTIEQVLESVSIEATSQELRNEKASNASEVCYQVMAEGLRVLGYQSLGSIEPYFSESAIVALEMLKLGALDSSLMEYAIPDNPVTSDGTILFLSRLFSIVYATSLDKHGWTGKVDKDLMAFNCLVGLVVKSLRNLFDSIALSLWLGRSVAAPVESIAKTALSLPFCIEHNVAVGLLMKEILMQPEEYTVERARVDFPNLRDPVKDAKLAMAFFDGIYPLARSVPLQQERTDAAKRMLERVRRQSQFFQVPGW